MTTISPCTRSVDLTDRVGITLYNKGCEALPIKFDRPAKMLPSCLAVLNLCATTCQWTAILTINDDDGNARHMITHLALTQGDLNVGITLRHNDVAKAAPPVAGHITEAEAQAIIKSRMLFSCLKESLTNMYLTSLTVILPIMEEDGPWFLYYMITKTHITTVLSTHDFTKDINTLDFKKFQYDVFKLHAAFDSLAAQLMVNKATPPDLNQIMSLFRAYKANTMNETFLRHIDNLELDWSHGVITTPANLRDKSKCTSTP